MTDRSVTYSIQLVLSKGPEAKNARMLVSEGRLIVRSIFLDGEKVNVLEIKAGHAMFSPNGILLLKMPGWKQPRELFGPGAVREIRFVTTELGERNPLLDRTL